MIEIICDVSTLEGTCYIEVLPDKYKGECWNDSSIFFTEENFGYIMAAFEKCYKNFDYYAFNEIDTDTWKSIVKELDKMKEYLASNPNQQSLKDVLGFSFFEEENIKQLISMITEFQSWIEEKSVSTKVISVLGM